jgi:hypothetical protein
MLDERLAFLRTVAAIGGWAPLLEIDPLRILPAEAESFVPGLVEAGLLEHHAEREPRAPYVRRGCGGSAGPGT